MASLVLGSWATSSREDIRCVQQCAMKGGASICWRRTSRTATSFSFASSVILLRYVFLLLEFIRAFVRRYIGCRRVLSTKPSKASMVLSTPLRLSAFGPLNQEVLLHYITIYNNKFTLINRTNRARCRRRGRHTKQRFEKRVHTLISVDLAWHMTHLYTY